MQQTAHTTIQKNAQRQTLQSEIVMRCHQEKLSATHLKQNNAGVDSQPLTY